MTGVQTCALPISADVIAKLNAAANTALADPATRLRLEELGYVVKGGTPSVYAELLRAETAKWRKVIAEGKIPAPN